MAMAVGIPIVPIVIRNAEIVAARNSTTMNPGTVDVAVFPPIPVDDWTLDTLAGSDRRGPPAVSGHAGRLAGRRAARNQPVSPRKEGGAEKGAAISREQAGQGQTAKATAAKAGAAKEDSEQDKAGRRPHHEGAQGRAKSRRARPPRLSGHASAQRAIVTRSAADTGTVHHRRRHVGVGVMRPRRSNRSCSGSWLDEQRARHPETRLEVLPLPARNAPPAALAQLVEQLESDERPIDRAGAGLLDAAGRRVGIEPGGRRCSRDEIPTSPASVSSATSCALIPSPRPGGGRRIGQGIRTSSAMARHHGRRKPA